MGKVNMSKVIPAEEFKDILESFQIEKYDELDGGVKRTFDTIMYIADERDFYKHKCEMIDKRLKKEFGYTQKLPCIQAYEKAIRDCLDLLDLKMKG